MKFKALVEAIHDLDVHLVRSEPEALLLEGKLIKEFHPRYNVSFRDDKRFLMLKGVNLNDPIPRFTLTRFQQDDGARYFGPFVHSLRVAQYARADPAGISFARLPAAHAERTRLQTLSLRQFEILHRAVHQQCDARAISRTE